MSNQTTNPTPANTFGTDWSTVWSTAVATDYVAKKRIWMVLILLTFAYIVGCILHATGYGLINIIIGTVAMLTVLVNAARPLTVLIFGLGGATYAGADKTVDLGPGLKAGLETLFRLANAVMMFIGLTFILLGTWPLAVPVWLYALVPMGTALIVNILVYEKMKSKGWVWKLGGTYIIALFILGALGNIPIINASLGWVNAQQERAAEAITENAKDPDAPKLERVIWQSGNVYQLPGGLRYLGTLPGEGAVFAQPVQHCVHAYAVSGQEATYVPAGTEESNPWGRVLVKPQPNDIGKEFEVWAVRC